MPIKIKKIRGVIMNILYINHYAGSPMYGMEYRPYYLTREWLKMGHKVTIIAASYSHVRSKNPICQKEIQKEIIDGIKYIWIKTPEYKGNGIKRVVSIFSFVGKLFKYSKKVVREINPDILIASSTYPLDIYPAYRILLAPQENWTKTHNMIKFLLKGVLKQWQPIKTLPLKKSLLFKPGA